jgi:hypothetical protein
MSCEAEAKATKSASQAIAARSVRGDRNAIPAIPEASASCVTSSHPRRLPRKGGTKRSIAGAHRNFHTYGRPTSVNTPIVDRSTPSTVIHACSVPPVSASGSPDEKPSRRMTARRRLRKTSR